MTDGITVHILGDSGPFSRAGKSIGYLVTIGEACYIIDCGAPLFQQIGGYGLKNIKGIIITHCHDDHKRWFTDLAIFYRYALDITQKVPLIATEDINAELLPMCGPALDRTLSGDSKTIIDVPYDCFVNHNIIGPRSKYRIISNDEGSGRMQLLIIDRNGNIIGPETAKIVINEQTRRPRMLFKDPYYKEWIEPESFYPFSSNVFYEEDKNILMDLEGVTIEAVKAPVWHGIPNVGIKFRTENETLFFSSDTVHDTKLWKQLYSEKRDRHLRMTKNDFEAASVIYGDINDYIERTWSEERYIEAMRAFYGAVVIHDVSTRDSTVHTGYDRLSNTSLEKHMTILTHSPDTLTSEWALCSPEKEFRIYGCKYFEVVNDRLYPMNADIYHKEAGKYFVGYMNEEGKYAVYHHNDILDISEKLPVNADILCRVDLYEDISGQYFPKLDVEHAFYRKRKDGKVELVEISEYGSRGEIVADCREELLKRSRKSVLKHCQ
jgi:ribonuclease BN (tRNA processing enzyme)